MDKHINMIAPKKQKHPATMNGGLIPSRYSNVRKGPINIHILYYIKKRDTE